MSMWKLYDELLAPIPRDVMVDEIIAGVHWTMVRVGSRIGVAATNKEETVQSEELLGKSWREVAERIKSWNLLEASIGMAAINAYYNNAECLDEQRQMHHDVLPMKGTDIFLMHENDLQNKKTAIIGHFKTSDLYVKNAANTYILERNPQMGDYPDSACEYILPDMECVFITGCTLINKTLPRLLELSKHAKVILVGPSAPIACCLFDQGVDEIGGTIFEKIGPVRSDIISGKGKMMAKQGAPLCIKKGEDN